MKTINNLSSTSTLALGDLLALWSTNNGDTRKVSMNTLIDFVKAQGGESGLTTINTYDELRQLDTTNPDTLSQYLVLGGDSVDDGKGGVYYWDVLSVSVDDDFTVIDSDQPGDGRWLRLNTSSFLIVNTFVELDALTKVGTSSVDIAFNREDGIFYEYTGGAWVSFDTTVYVDDVSSLTTALGATHSAVTVTTGLKGIYIYDATKSAINNTLTIFNGWVLQGELTLDTVTQIVDLTSNDEGRVVFVKDIDRGGKFIYDSSEVGNHNDGTNFHGSVRQYDNHVSVLWFGAKGDGTTDNTAIFTAVAAVVNIAIVPYTSSSYFISSTLVNTGTTFIFHGDSSQVTGTVTAQQLKAIYTDNGYINGVPVSDELRDKKIGIIAGTLRQDATTRSQWNWIKDVGHEPIGVDDSVPATATGDILFVNYDKTYTKTLVVSATPDETLASKLGMSVGTSVGLSGFNMKASVNLTLAASIKWNGTSWDIGYGTGQGGVGAHNVNITNVALTGANLEIDHDWIPGFNLSLIGFTDNGAVIPYIPVLKSTNTIQTVINFVDYAGAFVQPEDTRMSFVLVKQYNGGVDLDGTNNGDTLDLDLGNIWVQGIMQF